MSGFDNLMRTDQHIAQNRQFYDQQRYQSDRATAGIIGGIPGRMQEAQMNQQAMEQQKLQGALMERQVESDLRMQEAVMEQQFHQNKMNMALMYDQQEQSRLGVQASDLAVQDQALTFAERKKASTERPQSNETQRHETMLKAFGASGYAQFAKKIPEVDANGHLTIREPKEGELDQFIKDNPRTSDDPVDMMREQRMRAKDAAEVSQREKQDKLAKAKLAAEVQSRDTLTGDDKYAPAVKKQILEMVGMTPAEDDSTGAAVTSASVDTAIDTFASRITGEAFNDDQKRILAKTFATKFDSIKKAYDSAMVAGREVKRSPAEFGQYITTILSNPKDPRFEAVVTILNSLQSR